MWVETRTGSSRPAPAARIAVSRPAQTMTRSYLATEPPVRTSPDGASSTTSSATIASPSAATRARTAAVSGSRRRPRRAAPVRRARGSAARRPRRPSGRARRPRAAARAGARPPARARRLPPAPRARSRTAAPIPASGHATRRERHEPRVVVGVPEDPRLAAGLAAAGDAALVDGDGGASLGELVGGGEADDPGPDHGDVAHPVHLVVTGTGKAGTPESGGQA